MTSFKQKHVIKSYKLRLQDKLKTVSEETEKATSFLNNCLLEFRNRVDQILEIKDEKCLSLYRHLTGDLENFSEKLFILQASLEEDSEEESDSQNEENSEPSPCTGLSDSAASSSQNVATNVPSPLSVETNVRTDVEDCDFFSLPSDSIAQNIAGSLLSSTKVGKSNCETLHDKFESTQSFSQSSCYRSISSNIGDALALCNEVKETQSSQLHPANIKTQINVESQGSVLSIFPSVIKVPSTISATLSYIVNPADFWIQIENSHGSTITYPKSEYSSLHTPTSMKEGSFCLAPFKSSPFYYRAQSLTSAQYEDEVVKVHFIDHGSTQDIYLRDLKYLPFSAYDIPAQAIHCHLYGIAPIHGSWTDKCIERFKVFQNFCIETVIRSKEGSYAVQLIAKLSENLNEDFSVDIALSLCLEGLAISEVEPTQQSLNQNPRSENLSSIPICTSIDSPLQVSSSYDMTAISNDSGVSVTSAYKSSQNSANRIEDLDKFSGDYIPANLSTDCDKKFQYDTNTQNLKSYESYDALHLQNSNDVLKETDVACNSLCLICKSDYFCLHLKIPPPNLTFVEKDMMIVMLSHIASPHEFYVNMAMENIVNLDELREHMTSTYESQRKILHVNIEDLSENMFCAGYYEADTYWYRVKITRINSQDRKAGQVSVQYVDYGNTATIKCSDLLPLTPEFSQHSTFAIKCSLAGILPIEQSSTISPVSSLWNEDAIRAFKQLTSFERCLTAQICNELCNSSDTYPVLLWDTEESNDLLINLALADMGAAKFNKTLLPATHFEEASESPNNADILNEWDPMGEEYHDILNSYGVNNDDIQAITTGYQAKDEEYVCKYYSLRGSCPRGKNCRYMHVPLLESGNTRDQEEVYCIEASQILPENIVNVLVQVSAVINPGHFYVVLPFGCKSVDEIHTLVKAGASHEDISNNEAYALFHAMNKHYSNAPFQENPLVSLALGTIVVAKRKWDKQFHRGRVIDVSDVNGPSKIFFVDSGDSEWVPRRFIHTILPQYLYVPFQAVQCCLHGVKPIESKENKWSPDAVNYFKYTVQGDTLLAEIVHRLDQVIHVTLRKTSQSNHRKIGDLLVSEGFAKFCFNVPAATRVSQSRYLPG